MTSFRSPHAMPSMQRTILTTLAVLLLWAPTMVKTTAFSSSSVALHRRGGGGGGDSSSHPLRGGARLNALVDRPRQTWRLQSTVSLDNSNSNSAPQVLPSMPNSTVTDVVATEPTTTTTNQQPTTTTEASTAAADETTTTTTTTTTPFLKRIDGIVFLAYLANVMALSLPVLLVPIAVTEQATATATAGAGAISVAAQVAKISSLASLGGAVGKFVNGFVCQEFGSYRCSTVYLAGLGLCSLAFSLAPVSSSPPFLGLAFGGMEFFASIQWASLAVMLSNYYANQPVKLAAALTALGLSSTGGQIMAKFFGMTLSSAFHWRHVAQLGACVAFGGAALISRAPGREQAAARQQTKPKFQWRSVTESLKAVLGSKLFLVLGLCHAMAFVARGTDRILGTFFFEMAGSGLTQSVCGGLTLSITLGLVYGLITGAKKFAKCEDLAQKRGFLKKRYLTSVAATLGLTVLAHLGATGVIVNRAVISALVALMSGVMASNIAFQYFQFPAMIAQKYGDHKAVVIRYDILFPFLYAILLLCPPSNMRLTIFLFFWFSFLDGFGFLMSAPIFATMGKIVPTLGWSSGWTVLATLFGSAALLMLTAINPVLNLTKTPAEEAKKAAIASAA